MLIIRALLILWIILFYITAPVRLEMLGNLFFFFSYDSFWLMTLFMTHESRTWFEQFYLLSFYLHWWNNLSFLPASINNNLRCSIKICSSPINPPPWEFYLMKSVIKKTKIVTKIRCVIAKCWRKKTTKSLSLTLILSHVVNVRCKITLMSFNNKRKFSIKVRKGVLARFLFSRFYIVIMTLDF